MPSSPATRPGKSGVESMRPDLPCGRIDPRDAAVRIEGETSGSGPLEHIAALDGMRGVAILLVALFHSMPREGAYGLFRLAGLGEHGVDMFFVLSGFLITTLLYRQQRQPQAVKRFYIRRALRLFPLYYAIALGLILLTPVLHFHWNWQQFGFLVYLANYVIIVHPGLGHIGNIPLNHGWTLALEEQFYLLWPWLILPGRLSRKSLLRICLVGFVVVLALRVVLCYGFGVDWSVVLYSLPTRMDALFLGGALALMPLPSAMAGLKMLLAGCLLLGIAVAKGHTLSAASNPTATLGLTAAALISGGWLVLSIRPANVIHRLCSWSVLRFLGRYSYGIYLWHMLFIRWFERLQQAVLDHVRWHAPGAILGFALVFGLTTLIAVASYWILERPFLKLKDRFEPAKTRVM